MKIDRRIHALPSYRKMDVGLAYLDDIKCEYKRYKGFKFTDDILNSYAKFFTESDLSYCISFYAEMSLNHFEPDVVCEGIFKSPNKYVEARFFVGDMQYIDSEERENLLANMNVTEFVKKGVG